MPILKKKICLLGAFGVGKTSLTERFVHGRFSDKYLTTVGISVSQKMMPAFINRRGEIGEQHLFLIWDIAGFEKFDDMVMNYFRGAAGALAVCDRTRPESVAHLKLICDKFKSVCPESALLLIGNKSDLVKEGDVEPDGIRQLATIYKTNLILTSAKSGEQVNEAFHLLSEKIAMPDD